MGKKLRGCAVDRQGPRGNAARDDLCASWAKWAWQKLNIHEVYVMVTHHKALIAIGEFWSLLCDGGMTGLRPAMMVRLPTSAVPDRRKIPWTFSDSFADRLDVMKVLQGWQISGLIN
jgi:hypothetical protein